MAQCQFEVYRDNAGFWRWRLRASNGRIVADSAEGYVNRTDCEQGAQIVCACCQDAVFEYV
jgi:uncharacterized protein YegP (UPF0339 family)